jgi:hypothetical protein
MIISKHKSSHFKTISQICLIKPKLKQIIPYCQNICNLQIFSLLEELVDISGIKSTKIFILNYTRQPDLV